MNTEKTTEQMVMNVMRNERSSYIYNDNKNNEQPENKSSVSTMFLGQRESNVSIRDLVNNRQTHTHRESSF